MDINECKEQCFLVVKSIVKENKNEFSLKEISSKLNVNRSRLFVLLNKKKDLKLSTILNLCESMNLSIEFKIKKK